MKKNNIVRFVISLLICMVAGNVFGEEKWVIKLDSVVYSVKENRCFLYSKKNIKNTQANIWIVPYSTERIEAKFIIRPKQTDKLPFSFSEGGKFDKLQDNQESAALSLKQNNSFYIQFPKENEVSLKQDTNVVFIIKKDIPQPAKLEFTIPKTIKINSETGKYIPVTFQISNLGDTAIVDSIIITDSKNIFDFKYDKKRISPKANISVGISLSKNDKNNQSTNITVKGYSKGEEIGTETIGVDIQVPDLQWWEKEWQWLSVWQWGIIVLLLFFILISIRILFKIRKGWRYYRNKKKALKSITNIKIRVDNLQKVTQGYTDIVNAIFKTIEESGPTLWLQLKDKKDSGEIRNILFTYINKNKTESMNKWHNSDETSTDLDKLQLSRELKDIISCQTNDKNTDRIQIEDCEKLLQLDVFKKYFEKLNEARNYQKNIDYLQNYIKKDFQIIPPPPPGTDELEKLKGRIITLQNENERLETKIASLQAEKKSLESKKTDLGKEKINLEKQVSNLKIEYSTAIEKFGKINNQQYLSQLPRYIFNVVNENLFTIINDATQGNLKNKIIKPYLDGENGLLTIIVNYEQKLNNGELGFENIYDISDEDIKKKIEDNFLKELVLSPHFSGFIKLYLYSKVTTIKDEMEVSGIDIEKLQHSFHTIEELLHFFGITLKYPQLFKDSFNEEKYNFNARADIFDIYPAMRNTVSDIHLIIDLIYVGVEFKNNTTANRKAVVTTPNI